MNAIILVIIIIHFWGEETSESEFLLSLKRAVTLTPGLGGRIWITLPSIVWKLKLFNPGAQGLLCVDPETESQQDLNPSNNFRIKDLAKGLTLLRNKALREWEDGNVAFPSNATCAACRINGFT